MRTRSRVVSTVCAGLLVSAGLGVGACAEPAVDNHRLTVEIADTGTGYDGSFELFCDARGGTHPDKYAACNRLEQLTKTGENPFRAVPADMGCTQQYGGPATAHISGVWANRAVDSTFNRVNGCEIFRWDALTPVLPKIQ
ncbi:SSI family serine proteinase inhibitor [Nocardia pseudobrasiliensis]|uniref:Subtilisin inhibitor-like n=1 Tax=Nocardia pseudobrasiliensis TaxID=45979 RepID=A0A370IF00_9NOCA|nr:SSI family serine proteinase inhibitor [Nocardia pseudobrasiliensis]RDI68034.1 subtilisin inhibitor-like [Nocardia pseudobrasiliensis]